jgi:hypothetical protein
VSLSELTLAGLGEFLAPLIFFYAPTSKTTYSTHSGFLSKRGCVVHYDTWYVKSEVTEGFLSYGVAQGTHSELTQHSLRLTQPYWVVILSFLV